MASSILFVSSHFSYIIVTRNAFPCVAGPAESCQVSKITGGNFRSIYRPPQSMQTAPPRSHTHTNMYLSKGTATAVETLTSHGSVYGQSAGSPQVSLYEKAENIASNSFYCCVRVFCDHQVTATEPLHCNGPFPSNCCLCRLHNSDLQQTCRIMSNEGVNRSSIIEEYGTDYPISRYGAPHTNLLIM
jgi:hypothetical protein